MFPWADGDSLRDFWDRTPRQAPSKEVIHQAILQLRGLADALDSLHNFDGGHTRHHVNEDQTDAQHQDVPEMRVHNELNELGDYEDAPNQESIRHGDLKPENILRFLDQETKLGELKIADMGLAKRHVVETQDRAHLTSTRYGTIRYEAPETVTAIQGRSRLYDIWSMGCITLEFIIWILYGNEELNSFYNQVKGAGHQVCQYFEVLESRTPMRAKVHRVVLLWMDQIQNMDPECSQESAIRDLLSVVRTKLLVIPLPPNRTRSFNPGPGLVPPAEGEQITRYRATASEFRDALDGILSKVSRPGYLLTGKTRDNIKPPAPKSDDMLSPKAAQRPDGSAIPRMNPPTGHVASGVVSRSIRVSSCIMTSRPSSLTVPRL